MTINCVKAYKLLAVAQEKLDRIPASVDTLVEGIKMLDHLGPRELSSDTIEGTLKSDNG